LLIWIARYYFALYLYYGGGRVPALRLLHKVGYAVVFTITPCKALSPNASRIATR
jgi:hypothetical protein